MGKAVYVSDDTYEKIVNKANLIGVPISQALKAVVVNAEEQKLEEKPKENQPAKKENQPVFVALPPKNKENQEKNNGKEKKKMPELTKEDVLKIVVNGIRESKNQDQEKAKQEKSLEDLKTTLTKGLKDLQAKFCTPDGKLCFVTPEELQIYLSRQKREFEESMSKKLTEIAKTPVSTPQVKLPLLNKQIRSTMSEGELKARDLRVKRLLDNTGVSFVDAWRHLQNSEKDYESIKRKFFKGVSPEELMSKCDLGDKSACEKLYKASKLVVLKEDQKTKKWEAVYNPEAEEQKPKTGLFGLPVKEIK